MTTHGSPCAPPLVQPSLLPLSDFTAPWLLLLAASKDQAIACCLDVYTPRPVMSIALKANDGARSAAISERGNPHALSTLFPSGPQQETRHPSLTTDLSEKKKEKQA